MSGYTPYGGVKALWLCKEPIVAICGGAGTGKTVGALHKLFLYCSNHPGARALITRATRSSMTETTLAIAERYVFPENASWVIGAQRSHRTSYVLPNGSEIVVTGLDTPERILSSEFQFILIDEACELTEDQFELVSSRLRSGNVPYRQMILCTNPSYPKHWIKRFSEDGRIKLITSLHTDNPTLDAAYMDMLSKLTGHRRRRLFLGEWCSAEGLVYQDLAENSFIEAPSIEPAGTLFGGCDYGFADPKAFVLGIKYHATVGDIIYCPSELYMKFTPSAEFITKLKEVIAGREITVFADPSASEFIHNMQSAGITVMKAKNDVTYGIDAVNSLAREGRLFVSESCEKLNFEANSHAWHETISDRPGNDDYHHCLDALRYLCASVRYFNL